MSEHPAERCPVVALHGSAGSGAQWRSLVGYLEGRFRMHTPDLPAGGEGLASDARAVEALVARIGGPVHLVGHSYGGAVALKLAAMRPEAVRSLTVIEPAAFHLLRGGSAGDRALYEEAMAVGAAMEGRGRVAGMRGFIDFWNGPGAWRRTSAELRRVLLGRHERVRADFRAIAGEPDGMAGLGRIGCPALAVMGLQSPAVSLRVTELVAEALPRATLRLVPDAGHMAPWTDPHVIDPMIGNHLMAVERLGRQAAIAA